MIDATLFKSVQYTTWSHSYRYIYWLQSLGFVIIYKEAGANTNILWRKLKNLLYEGDMITVSKISCDTSQYFECDV